MSRVGGPVAAARLLFYILIFLFAFIGIVLHAHLRCAMGSVGFLQ